MPAIILFDGVCNLCNGAVRFILRNDKKDEFRFATTQSRATADLVRQYRITTSLDETFVLIENNHVFFRSDAALNIAHRLGWPWRAFVIFRWLPRRFRDGVYDEIASHRYRWFGRSDVCMVPGDEICHRFLE